MKATPPASLQPEVSGQQPDTGQDGRHAAPADGLGTALALAVLMVGPGGIALVAVAADDDCLGERSLGGRPGRNLGGLVIGRSYGSKYLSR
jgi:hypothetical protein